MNPMKEAWIFLKGNPGMRDADGKPIEHPAAMVYDNLRQHIPASRSIVRRHWGDERIADRMEEMKEPLNQWLVNRRAEVSGQPANPRDLELAQGYDERNLNRLEQHRQTARNETHKTMQTGNNNRNDLFSTNHPPPTDNSTLRRMPR
jgi:hypothetical protein